MVEIATTNTLMYLQALVINHHHGALGKGVNISLAHQNDQLISHRLCAAGGLPLFTDTDQGRNVRDTVVGNRPGMIGPGR